MLLHPSAQQAPGLVAMPSNPPRGVSRVETDMSGKPRIYIAGPLGFSEAGRHFYTSVLVPFVSGLGYDIADPWTLTDARKIAAVQTMPQGPDPREAWPQPHRGTGASHPAGDPAPPRNATPLL